MMGKLLGRLGSVIFVGGMVLGVGAAVAQDGAVTLGNSAELESGRLAVVAYSDPETEIGNGTSPPHRIAEEPENDSDADAPMEITNFPEGEISNGTNPPRVNP